MDVSYLCAAGLTAFVGLLLVFKHVLRSSEPTKEVRVPGLKQTHAEFGNFGEISKAGSLHQFLLSLHGKYGGIASFWWGKQWVVSISTPQLFKQHARLFDRPPELFAMFSRFITPDSIQYANGPEGQRRHAAYARCFSESAMPNYYPVIQANTREVIRKLGDLAQNEHFPLKEYAFAFAIKTVIQAVFGEMFFKDEAVLKLKRSYDIVWSDLENQLCGESLIEGTERMKKFQQECDNIHNTMKAALQKARENPSDDPSKCKFMDVISQLDISENERAADMVTTFVASFHTTGLLLTWALYYLASNPHVQLKAAEEAASLGELPSGPEAIDKLVYLKQVVDETLRCSVLVPYAARFSQDESELGGYTIPAGTPVIHALGVSLQDPDRWPEPQRFDPDRFDPAALKAIPAFGFEPFGFAGKRKCLGFRFGMVEAMILLAGVLRQFEVRLVDGQEVVPVHGLVTTTRDEIWLTAKKR